MIPFNFNAEVESARRKYPEETADIAFIDLRQKTAAAQLTEALFTFTPTFRRWFLGVDNDDCVDLSADLLAEDGDSFSLRDPFNNRAILAFNVRDVFRTPALTPEQKARIAFLHELAHLLDKTANAGHIFQALNGKVDPEALLAVIAASAPERENVADCFPSFVGLQEGWLRQADIATFALSRAKDATEFNDASHLTTYALDRIALTYDRPALLSLTPRDIKELAVKHATLHTPSAAEAEKVRMLMASAPSLTTAMTRALSGKSAATEPQVIHVASRLLADALAQGGATLPPVEKRRIQNILAAHGR